jgi:hypothetical protein
MQTIKKLRPDSKGRISLGNLIPKGVSSYTVTNDHGRLILEPNVEISAREKWLWDNKGALKQVKTGIEDSAAGRSKSRGDFTKFIDDESDV